MRRIIIGKCSIVLRAYNEKQYIRRLLRVCGTDYLSLALSDRFLIGKWVEFGIINRFNLPLPMQALSRIRWNRISSFPWPPVLLALYAPLELGAHNIGQVIQSILKNSSIPPIISIIQGDHGPSHFDEATRMGNLNAYYFPNAQPALYSSITPVNTFRLLFNTYFGTEFNLLKDTSYYSEYPYAYRFDVVPNQCRAKAN